MTNIGINQSARIDMVMSEAARESKAAAAALGRNALPEAHYHAQRTETLIADLQRTFYAAVRVDDLCSRGQCSGCDVYENCPAVPSLLVKQEGLETSN